MGDAESLDGAAPHFHVAVDGHLARRTPTIRAGQGRRSAGDYFGRIDRALGESSRWIPHWISGSGRLCSRGFADGPAKVARIGRHPNAVRGSVIDQPERMAASSPHYRVLTIRSFD